MVIVTDKEDMLRIKSFVEENFYGKLDYSPFVPIVRNAICVNAIALYDSNQPPLNESRNNLIIHIPLAQTVSQRDDIKDEYFGLVKEIANRIKEKSRKSRENTYDIFGFSPPLAGLDGKNKGLRGDGIGWFWFGKGLINCAQSARCSWLDGEDSRVMMVTNKTDLLKIKAFAWENFQWRLGCSPIDPEYRDAVYTNSISFYNIPLPLPQANQTLPDDNLIIHIPLSSQTTVERDEIVAEYLDLMRELENPKDGDSPQEKDSQPKRRKWFLW